MIDFNSNHVLVGQIKQILSTFNLPKYRVYTREDAQYYKNYGKEGYIFPTVKAGGDGQFATNLRYAPYIKDNIIQYYIAVAEERNQNESSALSIHPFKYHWEATNKVFAYDYNDSSWVRHLVINNNIYDSYTHEYLGDYLRFKRDYNQIDLMPLYNCFSNKICNSLDYAWTTRDTEADVETKIDFNSDNTNYKIYMLPVKLFKDYTIAIDCDTGIEICCGIYNKYQDRREKLQFLPRVTYKKYSKNIFNQPIVYSELKALKDYISVQSLSDLGTNEQDLKMFIKVPTSNDSTITILEGNYVGYNDSLFRLRKKEAESEEKETGFELEVASFYRVQNYAITNFDTKINDFTDFKPITALQLLRANTRKSYPFADRLIEYLLGNAIDSDEEILDNIRRVQEVIKLNNKYNLGQHVVITSEKDPTDPDKTIVYPSGKVVNKPARLQPELLPRTEGVWEPAIRAIVYDRFNNKVKANNNDTNHDILGYIDKEIEKEYNASTGIYRDANETKPIETTISGINIYKDE